MKIFLYILIFTLAFSLNINNKIYAIEDVTAPVLSGINVNQETVSVGNVIQVEVEGSDKESGLAPNSFINFVHPVTRKWIHIS
ncbi:hypothetical protein ON064_03520, partial [Planococcus sp. A6]|uniref:hypothetical protein n=1 Tax=Planococcus sp. A6 TaxID=2992760 RepID=UPI00237ADCDD